MQHVKKNQVPYSHYFIDIYMFVIISSPFMSFYYYYTNDRLNNERVLSYQYKK